jgi:pimeloyl-ACP methyl ester carboxylesterase
MIRRVRAGQLEIAFAEHGPADGAPAVLLHGYPDDIHAWDGVAPALAAAGLRVIVPYLRGYGPTRFLDDATPRSGEQAALGADLLALLDALAIPNALLAGYDWGGRACCVVTALWPERVRGLVTVGGYNVQNIARAGAPVDPAGTALLVPVVFLHIARRGGARGEPRGTASPAVAALVAELRFR